MVARIRGHRFAVMALVAAAAAPIVGRLVDRLGASRIVVAALTTIGLGAISLSMLTPSLAHLYAVCAVMGFATIGASGVAYSRVIFGWFDRLRGRALGTMLAGGIVSAIVLPPIVVRIIRTFGWRTAWVVLGITIIAMGLPIVIRFLRERPAAADAAVTAASGATIGEALRSRLFWTLIVVVFGAATDDERRPRPYLGAADRSRLLAGSRGGGHVDDGRRESDGTPAHRLVARPLSGAARGRRAAHRRRARWRVDGNRGFIRRGAVAGILIGGGAGGEYDINPYLLSRYFGLRSLATLYGFNWMALGVASAIGPILMGRAYDATGSYAVVLSELAVVTLVVAALILTLPARPRAASRQRRR